MERVRKVLFLGLKFRALLALDLERGLSSQLRESSSVFDEATGAGSPSDSERLF